MPLAIYKNEKKRTIKSKNSHQEFDAVTNSNQTQETPELKSTLQSNQTIGSSLIDTHGMALTGFRYLRIGLELHWVGFVFEILSLVGLNLLEI